MLKMNASGMYVTLLYGILDYRSGVFSYTRAGHLPPLFMDAGGAEVAVGRDEGQPLGLFEDVRLDSQRAVIPAGGLALLFSDGLNEAVDAQGKPFGLEGIRRELADHRGETAREIVGKLWEALDAHSGALSHQDDFVAVVVKRHAV
jgi:sigma-B regulation protein RsbU (phosphoserine phosphatase)